MAATSGSEPHDGNFVCDGMVWPDRRPKPAMWEHKRLAAPVRISGSPEDLAAGRVELANHQHFSDLGWLRASYSLTVGGDEVAAGAFGLPDLGPGERGTVALPGWVAPSADDGRGVPDGQHHDRRRPALGAGRLRGLRAAAPGRRRRRPTRHRRRRRRIPAGTVAARRGRPPRPSAAGRRPDPVAVARPDRQRPDRRDGGTLGGARRRPARAATRSASIATGRRTVVRSEFVTGGRDRRPARGRLHLPGRRRHRRRGDRDPARRADRPRPRRDRPRGRARARRTLRWFGSGPHETYPDRKRGGLVGVWRSTVTDQYVPYIRPQENGGHADVRWLELTDADGAGLRIDLDEPRQVSVTHLRAADLAAATHDVDVVPVAETVIHLDAAHRGLGTASCGPDTLPEYRLGAGTYRWAWTLRDLRPS